MLDKIKEITNQTTMTDDEVARSLHNQAEKGLPLNLQFFGGDGSEENHEGGSDGGAESETVELTQEELDKKIESESDRKLASALKKKEQELESQLQERIDKALEEQKRLSKLSEKEREQEQLTQREKQIAEREAEIERKILRSEAVDDLQTKGLPSDFADFLLGEDAEKTLENINNFKAAFDKAVNTAVKEKLRQDTPKTGTGAVSKNAPSVAELAKEHRLIK